MLKVPSFIIIVDPKKDNDYVIRWVYINIIRIVCLCIDNAVLLAPFTRLSKSLDQQQPLATSGHHHVTLQTAVAVAVAAAMAVAIVLSSLILTPLKTVTITKIINQSRSPGLKILTRKP